jgi:isopentenyl phosphate kinase
MAGLTFLKLGGSLITDKTRPYTARLEKLAELAGQIARAKETQPGLSLALGHGSGSFGHTAAREFGTRGGLAPRGSGGASEAVYWSGFAEVWFQASALNRLVMEALHVAGVPALALAPVAAVTAENGKVLHWDLGPLKSALEAGLVPVVYGDVVFDSIRGGTILSTEDLFDHLARELHPTRILLAGLEAGVWADFPARTVRVDRITPDSFHELSQAVGASHGADVTGGMESKVRQMLGLVQQIPGLTVHIFSGEVPGNIERALQGEVWGTLVSQS